MSSKHYQIAIIGSSLAARIAAALLAKSGRKVLFLRSEERLTSPWFFSSTFLEQLLGNLGGRGCFGPPRPFQVLSSKSRLCINGDAPLEDEMLREFGDHADPIIARFDKLLHTGQTLEALLWENDGLPLPGVKAAARLRYLCLRHKLRLSELNAPLHKLFDGLAPNCIEFCNNLFQGLSLQPYHSLSMAHGALLWAHALRSESILEPDFGELLEKRFNQFHGSSDSLSNLQQLDYDGSRYTGGIMKEGGHFSADLFLLGSSSALHFFNESDISLTSHSPTTIGIRTTSLSGQLSPLLAQRAIIGGDTPLRLFLRKQQDEISGYIGYGGTPNQQQIRDQLEPTLPFAKYDLLPTGDVQVDAKAGADDNRNEQIKHATYSTHPGPHSLFGLPLQSGPALYRLDCRSLCPALSSMGEALLGWTLANCLGEREK